MYPHRRIERVTLGHPIMAFASGEPVQIVDASVRGVRLTHENLLAQRDRCAIAFDWKGQEIEFVGRVRWTRAQRDSPKPGYQSGLEISAIDEQSTSALRTLIQSYVERALEEQKANARGVPPATESQAQTGRAPLYVRHELVYGIWRKTTTTEPRQPESGFTVLVGESPHQVDLLRAAYSAADRQTRDMIRALAELSLSNPDDAPRRFIP